MTYVDDGKEFNRDTNYIETRITTDGDGTPPPPPKTDEVVPADHWVPARAPR